MDIVKKNQHDKQREFLTAVYADLPAAEKMFRSNPECLHYRSHAGETTFHYLIVESDLLRAAKLLEWGSDINTQDDFGATPLIIAAVIGDLEVVKWLVQHGADLDLKNMNGETALVTATRNERAAIFQFLISVPRDHPIDFYYDDLSAQEVCDNEDLVMRDYLISLGLSRRYEC